MSSPNGFCTAFDGPRRVATGTYAHVARSIKGIIAGRPDASVLIFDDATGKQIDFDLRGTDAEIAARLSGPRPDDEPPDRPRGPGRPKLGVVAREVTLLPRHWEWLGSRPGGASVTLRRLVDDARRADARVGGRRQAQESAYRFMSATAGNLPGFEEAARALFADDRGRFEKLVAAWPSDLRDHAVRLAFGDRV